MISLGKILSRDLRPLKLKLWSPSQSVSSVANQERHGSHFLCTTLSVRLLHLYQRITFRGYERRGAPGSFLFPLRSFCEQFPRLSLAPRPSPPPLITFPNFVPQSIFLYLFISYSVVLILFITNSGSKQKSFSFSFLPSRHWKTLIFTFLASLPFFFFLYPPFLSRINIFLI